MAEPFFLPTSQAANVDTIEAQVQLGMALDIDRTGHKAALAALLLIGWPAISSAGQTTAAIAAHSAAQLACERIKDLQLANTRISVAEFVRPAPSWPYPYAPAFAPMARPTDVVKVPFCRAAGVIGAEINFEVWMPLAWNGRYQMVGNGGLSGAINYPTMGTALSNRYATSSTDTGHKTEQGFFDSSWVAGHPQRVINFGHRANHVVTQAAERIIATFYGEPARYSYFTGCSAGGAAALSEAQKYPEDFDGVVVGAPASNFVRLLMQAVMDRQATLRQPEGNLSQSTRDLIAKAATAKCDPQDGVVDGIVSRPDACDFDPVELQCKGEQQDGCLNPAQVKRAQDAYAPRRQTAAGTQLYPGRAPGTRTFAPNLTPPAKGTSLEAFIPMALKQKPGWDETTFDPDKHLAAIETELGPTMDANDPDLRAFKKGGGRILMYHGWADAGLSPYNSIDYYERVAALTGSDDIDGWFRLFLAPGMGHCDGGAGPNKFDALAALEKWVEKNIAPDTVIASRLTKEGKVDMTRPLCPYPKAAKYRGSGATNDAANFVCAP